jgi:hypothetical protein
MWGNSAGALTSNLPWNTQPLGTTVSDSDVISLMKALLTASGRKYYLDSDYGQKSTVYTIGLAINKISNGNTPTYGADALYANRLGPTLIELAQVMLNPGAYISDTMYQTPQNELIAPDGAMTKITNNAAYRIQQTWNTYDANGNKIQGKADAVLSVPASGAHSPYTINYVIQSPKQLNPGWSNISTLNYVDKAFSVDNTEELQAIFNSIISSMETPAQPAISSNNGTGLVFTDPIGDGMQFGELKSVTYNGKTLTVTGDATNGYKLSYASDLYSGVSENPVNLEDIKITVTDKTTVKVEVSPEALPTFVNKYTNNQHQGCVGCGSPLQVTYTVVKAGNSEQAYSNAFTEGSADGNATAVFTPSDTNEYYKQEGHKDTIVAKSSNATGTAANASHTKVSDDGKVTVALGNNGRLGTFTDYTASISFKKISYNTPLADASFELTVDGQTWNANSNSNGIVTFTGLPLGKTYTLKETSAPKDYQKSDETYTFTVTDSGKDSVVQLESKTYTGLTIQNKKDPHNVTVTVTKEWQGDLQGLRPDDLTVTLTGTSVLTKSAKEPITISGNQWTKNGAAWTATVTLPTVDVETGELINYAVSETIPEGFHYAKTAESDTQVVWTYQSDTDTSNPSTITKGTAKLVNKLTTQNTPDGPDTPASTKDITVKKVWLAPANKIPQSLRIELLCNRTGLDPASQNMTATLTGGNWQHTFSNMPDSTYYVYGAKETTVPEGFKCLGTSADGNTITITNAIEQENFTINGTKVWKGEVPSGDVTVTLTGKVGDRTVYTDTATLSENKDTFTFNNVPKYDVFYETDGMPRTGCTGQEISYTVSDNISGFTAASAAVSIPEGDSASVMLTNIRNDINATINITVTKVWSDERNAHNTRPENGVELTLQKLVNGQWEDVQTATVGSGKVETPVEPPVDPQPPVTPPVEELQQPVAPGEPDLPVDMMQQPIEGTELPGIDGQPDEGEVFGIIPDAQEGELPPQDTGIPEGTEILPQQLEETGNNEPRVQVTWENSTAVTFNNLPKYDENGQLIKYGVTEKVVPTNYTSSVAAGSCVEVANGTATITNTLNGDTTSITVTKNWVDQYTGLGNKSGRPSATVTLYSATYGYLYDYAFSGAADQETHAFTVPAFVTDWAVNENAPTGYTATVNNCTVTNTIAQDSTETVTAQKIWDGNNTYRPGIKFQLVRTADGVTENVREPVAPDPTTGICTWNGLDTYHITETAGHTWTYSVVEQYDAGSVPECFNAPVYAEVNGVLTVTNTFKSDTVTAKGMKTWVLPSNAKPTAEQVAAVEFSLYRVGYEQNPIATARLTPSTVDDETVYSYAFPAQPKYDSTTGEVIQYIVKETGCPEGFTSADMSSGSVESGQFVNTSTELGKNASINVTKTWLGPEDKRPTSIGITISGTGSDSVAHTHQATLTAADSWTATITSEELPMYDSNHNPITYTVTENGVSDGEVRLNDLTYAVSCAKESTGWTITNTVKQDTVAVSGEKKWVDLPEDSAFDKAKEKVTVQLWADGNPVAGKTADLTGETWSYRFENLPKYALAGNGLVEGTNGHEIVYTVHEINAGTTNTAVFTQDKVEYVFTVSGGGKGASGAYDITNTYQDAKMYQYKVTGVYTAYNSTGNVAGEPASVTLKDLTAGSRNEKVTLTAAEIEAGYLTYNGRAYTFDASDTANVLEVELKEANQTYELILHFIRRAVVTWLRGDNAAEQVIRREEIDPSEDYRNLYPTNPTRSGYEFTGWSDPVDDGEGNLTITAQWREVTTTPVIPDIPFIPDIPYTPTPTPAPTPGTTITDEETPLGGSVGLNDTDHFAYVIGYEDDTVRPLNNITRAEAATIFFRLMTDEYRQANWSTTNSFSDVNAGDWYNNAVSTCANAGVLKGYEDGTFRPNAPITRAEFASMAAGFMDESITDDGTGDFSDTANHWAAVAIRRAAKAGWVTGSGNKFNPDAKITRAEVMTIVNRMLNRTPDKDHMLPEMKKWTDNPEDAWYYEAVQEATNEHDYERDDLNVETWTELLTVRDWKALETEWANNGGASAPKADDTAVPEQRVNRVPDGI